MTRIIIVALAACCAMALTSPSAFAQGAPGPSPGSPASPSETAPSNGGLGQGVEKILPAPETGPQGASPAPSGPPPAQPHDNGCPYRDRKLELIV
jgi:hypothetical protein